MSRATLSLLGLYQYDNTIFNELVLPEGMDKQVYINNLLMETAEMISIHALLAESDGTSSR